MTNIGNPHEANTPENDPDVLAMIEQQRAAFAQPAEHGFQPLTDEVRHQLFSAPQVPQLATYPAALMGYPGNAPAFPYGFQHPAFSAQYGLGHSAETAPASAAEITAIVQKAIDERKPKQPEPEQSAPSNTGRNVRYACFGALGAVVLVAGVYMVKGKHETLSSSPNKPSNTPATAPATPGSSTAEATATATGTPTASATTSGVPSATSTAIAPGAGGPLINREYTPGPLNIKDAATGTVLDLESPIDQTYVFPNDPTKKVYHIFTGPDANKPMKPAYIAAIDPTTKKPFGVTVSILKDSGAISVDKTTYDATNDLKTNRVGVNIVTADRSKFQVSTDFSSMDFLVTKVDDPLIPKYLDPVKALPPALANAVPIQLNKIIKGDSLSTDPAAKAGEMPQLLASESHYLASLLQNDTYGPKLTAAIDAAIIKAVTQQAKDEGVITDQQHFKVNFGPTSLPDLTKQYPPVVSKAFTVRVGSTVLTPTTIVITPPKGN